MEEEEKKNEIDFNTFAATTKTNNGKNHGRGLRYTMCKVLEGLRKVDRK